MSLDNPGDGTSHENGDAQWSETPCPLCGERAMIEFWSGVTVCDGCGHVTPDKPGKEGSSRMATYLDRDATMLAALTSPGGAFETRIDIPEFTCLGAKDQPDFAVLRLWFYPRDDVIELKSLKRYLHQYRNLLVSYERVVNCLYDDLLTMYRPHRLRIEASFRPRGGISSTLVIDSDWGVRGGEDQIWRVERHENLTYA